MALTYAWVSVPDTDTDPDSPVTTNLMTGMNHNTIRLREMISGELFAGENYGHIHDGVGSMAIPPMIKFLDHFTNATLDTYEFTGGPATRNINLHYGIFLTTDTMISDSNWRSDQIPMIVEARIRMSTGTSFSFDFGAQDTGVTRRAVFSVHATADHVSTITVGSGGTETQDAGVVGGGGVDAWHIYRVDLRNPASVVFSIDGTVVTTHTTRVPTGADIHAYAARLSVDTFMDYFSGWASINPLSTA